MSNDVNLSSSISSGLNTSSVIPTFDPISDLMRSYSDLYNAQAAEIDQAYDTAIADSTRQIREGLASRGILNSPLASQFEAKIVNQMRSEQAYKKAVLQAQLNIEMAKLRGQMANTSWNAWQQGQMTKAQQTKQNAAQKVADKERAAELAAKEKALQDFQEAQKAMTDPKWAPPARSNFDTRSGTQRRSDWLKEKGLPDSYTTTQNNKPKANPVDIAKVSQALANGVASKEPWAMQNLSDYQEFIKTQQGPIANAVPDEKSWYTPDLNKAYEDLGNYLNQNNPGAPVTAGQDEKPQDAIPNYVPNTQNPSQPNNTNTDTPVDTGLVPDFMNYQGLPKPTPTTPGKNANAGEVSDLSVLKQATRSMTAPQPNPNPWPTPPTPPTQMIKIPQLGTPDITGVPNQTYK